MQINIVHHVHSHNSDKAITGLRANNARRGRMQMRHIVAKRISLLTVERNVAFRNRILRQRGARLLAEEVYHLPQTHHVSKLANYM